MSIIERVRRIEEEELEQQLAKEKRERELEEARSRRYSEKLPEVMVQRAHLLEQLREIGVLEMIEELTGDPIEPLRDSNGDYIVRKPSEIKRAAQPPSARLEYMGLFPEYVAKISAYPEMNDEGLPSQDLKIEIIHNREVGIPNMSGGSGWAHDLITLCYRQDGLLIVSGEKVEFWGDMSEGMQLDGVKEALARSIVHPECPKHFDPSRIFFG